MRFPTLVLFFILCSFQYTSGVQHLLNKVARVYDITERLINVSTTARSLESMLAKFKNENTGIGEVMTELMTEVKGIKNTPIDEIFNFIKNLMVQIRSKVNMFDWARKIKDDIRHIDVVYGEFSTLYDVSASVQSWASFSERHLHLDSKMQDIKTEVTLPLLQTFFSAASKDAESYCDEAKFMPYFLMHFLQKLLYVEMKAVTMSSHGYLVQYAEKQEWIKILPNMLTKSKNRVRSYVRQIATLINVAPKILTPCDPPNGTRKRDETYFEIERLEQAVIFHFKAVFDAKNCGNAVKEKDVNYDSEGDKCEGKLIDCKYSGALNVCRLTKNVKRYGWIKSDFGDLGNNLTTCPKGEISKYEGFSNWRTSHCICTCQEPTDNRLSLDLVMTDVANDKVVTGLRFIRKNSILHLQVKQGTLQPDGWIDSESEEWVPLKNAPNTVKINSSNSVFYLDQVILPTDHLAVGVQLYVDHNYGFALRVFGKKADLSSGKLLGATINSTNSHANFYHPLFFPGKNSIYTNRVHTVDSRKHWVKLMRSDLKGDAGQSVLPLFDGIAIEAYGPVGGIGIVHKGVPDYAGFVSPTLFPPQYHQHLRDYRKSP